MMPSSSSTSRSSLTGWLYVSPLVGVLVPFFLAPILVVLAASFFGSDGFGGLTPGFTLANYVEVLHSALTLKLYLATIKFTVLTWIFTLLISFFVAYFLVFHVRNQLLAIGLFLLCTVPFWTSNIIRMISWIPLLGKEGLINAALISTGVIRQPLEVLLFSDLAVVIAYVHQLTIFMIVPIFNAMARIDKRLIEAAIDAGASRFDILRLIVVPQALRVILPPLTNQYLNLTKNSSLAVAIGYPDLVSVFAGTTMSQTGQAIEIIAITMGVYLAISLITSAMMSFYSWRLGKRLGA